MRILPAPRPLALWRAPALLLLFQAAPVDVHLDEAGRFRLAIGLSRGVYENREYDCAGNVTDRANVHYSTVGGNAEAWLTPTLRAGASAGVIHGSTDANWGLVRDGGYGGLTLAIEGRKVGVGGGLLLWPTRGGPTETHPSIYLRFGPAEKLHFRVDDDATSAPGAIPGLRMGIGSGFGQRHQGRFFLGMVLWPVNEGNPSAMLGGEFGVPAIRGLEPVLRGMIGGPSGKEWNLGVGLRAGFGR